MGVRTIGIALVLMTAAGCASTAAPVASVPDPEVNQTAIAARQAAFQLSQSVLGGMKGAIDRGDAVKGQAFPARALAKWGATLPRLFPAGSIGTGSRAKAGIWANRADFEAKAAALSAAATELAAAADRDDKAAFAVQWTVTQQTCGACHSVYRENAPRR